MHLPSSTGLAPFWNGISTYWDSTECRDWTQLGYNYPEFVGFEGQTQDEVADHIKDIVDQLYGGGTGGSFGNFVNAAAAGNVAGAAQAAGAAVVAGATAAAQAVMASSSEEATVSPASQSVRDWSVRIQSKKFQLGGSYSILIFIGSVPEDPKEWRESTSYVGSDEVFANSAAGHCANCVQNADMVVEGYVHLNQALARAGLTSLDPDVVAPYLKDNLSWRVYQVCSMACVPATVG